MSCQSYGAERRRRWWAASGASEKIAKRSAGRRREGRKGPAGIAKRKVEAERDLTLQAYPICWFSARRVYLCTSVLISLAWVTRDKQAG